MSLGKGIASKAAAKVETSSYGTAIALNGSGETNQIHLISESLTKSTDFGKAVTLDGDAAISSQFKILDKYAGDLVLEVYYSGLEKFFACALGMTHQNMSPSYDGSAYTHYFEPSNDLSTRAFTNYEMNAPSGNAIRRMTIGIEKDVSIWEFASAMIDSMTFEATPERIQATFSVVAKTVEFDSATNNESTNWALPSESQVLFGDANFYLVERDLFTIEASSNDTLIVDEGGGSVTVTIDEGAYIAGELAQNIETKLNANTSLSNTYTVRYINDNRKFEIDADGSFIVKGTGLINRTIGFTTSDTGSDTKHGSTHYAVTDGMFQTVESSGNKIAFSKITVSLNNNLDTGSQDATTGQEIAEPERAGMREVKVTLEMPRYNSDALIKGAKYSTVYSGVLVFQGNAISSDYEELKFYFPQLIFNSAKAPVDGADLIKVTFDMDAQAADRFYDFVNFDFIHYLWMTMNTADQNVNCFGAYTDGLYAGGVSAGASELMKWDGTSWSVAASSTNDGMESLKQFQNSLFVGCEHGVIYEWDGTSLSTSTDVGDGTIKDFELYDDKLYACEDATGKVFAYDGSSWSLSCDTVATAAFQLKAYNNKLYFAAADTNGKVFAFDGTTWSTSCDFGAGTNNAMALEVHDGFLYASVTDSNGHELFRFDGSTWTKVLNNNSSEIKFLLSYRDMLLIFPYGTSQDVYFFEDTYYPSGSYGSMSLISSSINLTFTQQPVQFAGCVFMPIGTATPKFFKPAQDIMISNTNTNSHNPL